MQIDSDIVGRIPLCTYVIDDGTLTNQAQRGNSKNGSNPIIHPEFGCVTCKVITESRILLANVENKIRHFMLMPIKDIVMFSVL